MSDSPPPEKDVEQNAQSGEEQDNIDRNEEGAQGQGMTDFEVKEQDRWLPIANGMIMSHPNFSFARLFPATCASGPVQSREVCDNAGCSKDEPPHSLRARRLTMICIAALAAVLEPLTAHHVV